MQNQLPVFVYGTLRSEFGNHRTFGASVKEILRAQLDGATMVANGIPYVYRTPHGAVVGELITIDPPQYDETLQRLDQLEGYRGPNAHNFYNREIVDVTTRNGETIKAYTYLVDDSYLNDNQLVPTGDYADYVDAYAASRRRW